MDASQVSRNPDDLALDDMLMVMAGCFCEWVAFPSSQEGWAVSIPVQVLGLNYSSVKSEHLGAPLAPPPTWSSLMPVYFPSLFLFPASLAAAAAAPQAASAASRITPPGLDFGHFGSRSI
ncbi:hypothetical protein THAOC_07776 [Thalassiosira oceanica]|uniref:Uncharacterized protein n=1 Tax=Thalassiosira oceanica TaxID=159749 RepID=K0SZH2_THAOC|nr:hypothetical protein THAOC_07776 [Thalassiosira oceanica]|eukprot:EJK70835.1 hypothetical protein THAOC_07776 [Thalassiosira oceanica]